MHSSIHPSIPPPMSCRSFCLFLSELHRLHCVRAQIRALVHLLCYLLRWCCVKRGGVSSRRQTLGVFIQTERRRERDRGRVGIKLQYTRRRKKRERETRNDRIAPPGSGITASEVFIVLENSACTTRFRPRIVFVAFFVLLVLVLVLVLGQTHVVVGELC